MIARVKPQHGDEYILTLRRSILKHRSKGHVPVSNLDPLCIGGYQCAGDSQFFGLSEQSIWIPGLECQAQNSCHRRQRDVTLVPIQSQSQDLTALVLTFADNANILHASGIGPC